MMVKMKQTVVRLLLSVWLLQSSFTCMVSLSQLLGDGTECDQWSNKTVTLQHGTVKGFTMTSYHVRSICSFTGIPFAQPPVGDLRFKEPQPMKPWEGVLDATKDCPQCVHLMLFSPVIAGQEDCLYLNVYTPRLSAGPNGELLDVLVFIFPGEYYFGSSSRKVFNPGYLADKDIVLVTFSYRLGAFGYLSTGDDEAPGNYGMKDQVAALRWVKDNIQYFGGNASSVTLFGHSAGSSSVEYHLLSPLSKGLFHKAISMEGSVVNPWARCPDPLKQAQKQATAMDCPTEPTDKLVACLRSADYISLQRSIFKLFVSFPSSVMLGVFLSKLHEHVPVVKDPVNHSLKSPPDTQGYFKAELIADDFLIWEREEMTSSQPWLVLPSPGYAPVIETKTDRNPEPFISEDPVKMIKDGKFQNIPWLLGGNSEPAGIFAVPVLRLKKALELVNSNSDNFYKANLMMWISAPEEDVMPLTKKVVQQYMGSDPRCGPNNSMQLIDMLGDRMMTHGVYKSAVLHSQAGHAPIYKYNLDYRPLLSATQITAPLTNYGTSHGDELQFFFMVKNSKSPELPGHPDHEVRELLLTLWTNFAKYGNPTPDDVPEEQTGLMKGLKWEPIRDPQQPEYLNIGQEGHIDLPSPISNLLMKGPKVYMDRDLYGDRMRFWDSLPLSENA